jgi:signal transduction histidine kinase
MEAIATLTGGIAHDFNNLLAVMLGNTELAILDLPEDHPARGCLTRNIATIFRAKGIVKELLSFASRSSVERGMVSLDRVVRNEIERLKATAPPGIKVVTRIGENLDPVLGDPMQIPQILANLCGNALDAMSEGGTLEIFVENRTLSPEETDFDPDLSPGRYVCMGVRDTGVGIEGKNIGRLFDPYYTTKGIGKGDGLGLAVVHGIVKRHGGGIRVVSEKGKGAIFEIFFPAIKTGE